MTDQFILLGRLIADSFGGSFYNFGTYSALTCDMCFVRSYIISGRTLIVASINHRVFELEYTRCITIMWRIYNRIAEYTEVMKILPMPILDELLPHLILPINIVFKEFST